MIDRRWSALLTLPGLMLGVLFIFAGVKPLGAGARAAQSDTGHLDAVEITGSKRFASKRIVQAMGIKTGSAIDKQGLQQIADRLSALGAFSTVRYHYSTVVTGVRATYEVTDALAFPAAFDNFPWFTDDELSNALKSAVPLYDGSAPATGALVDSMDDALEKFLDGHGIHSRVSNKVVPLPDRDVHMQQFHVDDSAITLQAIEFSDALAKSDRHIEDRLPDIVGQPYSRARIEIFEFEQVRPIYLQHAFMRVKFGAPAATFPANAANPLVGGVTVAAPVQPGPAYQFGGVTWSGNSMISAADLDSLVELKAGDPANGEQIAGIWERVSAKCAQAGFLSADVDPIERFDDKAARVSYEVRIKEGPQFHMNNLVLTGLSVEGERRVRQAFPIPQDAIFDKTAFLIFMDKGLKAAFAGLPVHYSKIGSFLQPDPEKAKVDVLLDFQ